MALFGSSNNIGGGLVSSVTPSIAQYGYPASTNVGPPFVYVIDHNHPEPLHFRTADGKVHSFTVEEAYRLLGLSW